MKYDVVIVGGGIAGLTSAAFLTKEHKKVLLCEKEDHVGGLVSTFEFEGFLYDAGVRGIVDSGIVKPMLKQLNIDVEFIKSIVTIGIENEMIRVETIESLNDYREMLIKLYPDSISDIDVILKKIREVMDYMDILYGIENPLFKDLKRDKEYLFKTLFPWLFKFIAKSSKIKNFKAPIDDYLKNLTDNQSLIDIISQHFFQKTPASFALSYFSLYLDYEYPINGTIDLVNQIAKHVLNNGGEIKNKTKIQKIDYVKKLVFDQDNNAYEYKQLIWAADQNRLYKALDTNENENPKVKSKIDKQKRLLVGKRGGDSIYSMFMAVDLDKDYFESKASGHCFYTPKKYGQSKIFNNLKDISKSQDKQKIINWMKDYLDHTTYEIAIPSLRNPNLAPKGKTGLVVSVLMDYDYISNIKNLKFYDEFKQLAEDKIIDVLNNNLYPGIKEKVIHHFSSTPLTIEKLSGNLDGGITGWAFTNDQNPAINKMTKVIKSCLTPIPNILQAGQWTFSPSGLPISILTGKIAADKANKMLRKAKE
ncbi:MAG: NAD(P)/FAD-dependent oxidoreductase [Tenericutes bacterium HGW-Tenericutes-5]|jgi:phytoene dehydrogenase-like protein|nr:MAG: NAD(P)/FAD-dependent oxidoreductase [Tenericutes bacterium HGW-Tenericutes-5]